MGEKNIVILATQLELVTALCLVVLVAALLTFVSREIWVYDRIRKQRVHWITMHVESGASSISRCGKVCYGREVAGGLDHTVYYVEFLNSNSIGGYKYCQECQDSITDFEYINATEV